MITCLYLNSKVNSKTDSYSISFLRNSTFDLYRAFIESNDNLILSEYVYILFILDKHTYSFDPIFDFALDATITNIKFCVYFYL